MVTGEYTEIEWELKELTSSDPWGCSPTEIQTFIDELHSKDQRHEAIQALRKRLAEGTTWRNIYKALNVLDHILKHASESFIGMIIEDKHEWNIILAGLNETFEYIDEKGKDQGINVRVKAGSIIELLADSSLLVETRRVEQDKREIMLKRRQEFSQHGNPVRPVSSSPDSWIEKPSTANFTMLDDKQYSPLDQKSPNLLIEKPTETAKTTELDDEEEFADFQAAEKPTDPFSDLM